MAASACGGIASTGLAGGGARDAGAIFGLEHIIGTNAGGALQHGIFVARSAVLRSSPAGAAGLIAVHAGLTAPVGAFGTNALTFMGHHVEAFMALGAIISSAFTSRAGLLACKTASFQFEFASRALLDALVAVLHVICLAGGTVVGRNGAGSTRSTAYAAILALRKLAIRAGVHAAGFIQEVTAVAREARIGISSTGRTGCIAVLTDSLSIWELSLRTRHFAGGPIQHGALGTAGTIAGCAVTSPA